MGSQRSFRYALGLDLGTASVGWALVRVPDDETEAEIVRLGVRKFSEVYTKGDSPDKKNCTTNKERRDARQQRQQTLRKRGRRRATLRLLRGAGLAAPQGEPFPDLARSRFSPYDIWNRAYDQDLSPHEFGAILYVLSHRRGFRSNLGAGLGALKDRPEIARYVRQLDEAQAAEAARNNAGRSSAKNEDDDEGKTLVQIGHWKAAFGDVPLGKFFYALLNPGEGGSSLANLGGSPEAIAGLQPLFQRQQLRNRASNPLWCRPDRAAYEAEFDRLWERQAHHLGLSDQLRADLKKAIFFQNELEFPADNRAFCMYGTVCDSETGEVKKAHRAPRCSLLFQEYRLRKLLSDMKVKDGPDADLRHLTLQESRLMYAELSTHREVSYAKLRRLAREAGAPQIVLLEPEIRSAKGTDYTSNGMKGNAIAAWFDQLDPSEEGSTELRNLWDYPERVLRKDLLVEWRGTPRARRENVRNHLVRLIGEASFTRIDRHGTPLPRASAERVVQLLQTDFCLSDVAAFRLALAPFPGGYGRLSYMAMAKLLPRLREGKLEWEAIDEVFGLKTRRTNSQPLTSLPSPPDPRDILSPRVRKSLNQARLVINDLLAHEPDIVLDEIRIELARRLQAGNEEYLSHLAYQAYNRKMNEQALSFWNANRPNDRCPRSFSTRYRLWIEQGAQCPYSTGVDRSISQADLLNNENLEIDHILTLNVGGDGYGNKVLVKRTANQAKQCRMPWEMPAGWQANVASNVSAWPVLSSTTDSRAATQTARADRIKPPPRAVDIARAKREKLLRKGPDARSETGFAERQAVETGYIARTAVEYLSPLAHNVTAVKATFTTSIARNWGFYRRLNDLHKEQLDRVASSEKERVLLRHHAVDALAAALSTPAVIHKVVQLEKQLGTIREVRKSTLEEGGFSTPLSDAQDDRARWLRRKLGEMQPTAIANGLTGCLANIVVSHAPRRKPRGKFFKEKPLGLSRSATVLGQKPRHANRFVRVSDLKPEHLFPNLRTRKPKNQEEGEEPSGKSGFIKSPTSRSRLLAAAKRSGVGPQSSSEEVAMWLATLSEGVWYDGRRGPRRMSRVLLQVPCDDVENYFSLDQDGGGTLYTKHERHCAVIFGNGRKAKMIVLPLVDAALAQQRCSAAYRETMLNAAASRAGLDRAALADAQIFHKGDMVEVRKWGETDWCREVYVIETLDGAGRLWLRAHWSASTETTKAKHIGDFLIASATVWEVRPVSVSPAGFPHRPDEP